MANEWDEMRDADLGGDYARDPHPDDFGGDYARERWWGSSGSRGGSTYREMRSFRGRGPKNYHRSDDLIADDIHRLLTDDDDLDATNIDVKVEKGDVTLAGSVSSRWAKRHAEDVVAQCPGVYDVQNRLTLEPTEAIGKASE